MGKIEFPKIKPYAEIPREGWGLYYDPLYGYIPLPITVRRAMDLPTVQRLRWLKQLSTASLIFPGANHTRFEHSVGVFHLATRAFNDLFNKAIAEDKKEWPPLKPEHKLALQLAALFHDVGHGPWSHAFDIFCETNPSYREFRHEIITEKLITSGIGPYDDIPKFLNALCRETGESILGPECIANIAVGRVPRQNESYLFLSQIISSEYDVDRMDYLQRDALHTGIGMEVDIWEILHAFIIDPVGDIPQVPTTKFTMGDTSDAMESPWQKSMWSTKISATAAPAVESLLTGRDLAYRRVYYQKTHRCATAMIVAGLQDISKILSENDEYKLALLTDEGLLNLFERGTEFTKDIARRIRLRKIYEPLPFEIERRVHLSDNARRKLADLIRPKTIEEYSNYLEKLDNLSEDIGLGKDSKVILDAREIPISRENEYTRKYFYDEAAGESKSLVEVFPHLNAVIDRRDEYIDQISKILVSLPFDLIDGFILEKKQQTLHENLGLSELSESECKSLAEDIFQSKIKAIGLGLVDILSIEDDAVKHRFLWEFEEKLTRYLARLLGRR